MILKHEQISSQEDIEVFITYPKKNKMVESIISFVNSIGSNIECSLNGNTMLINIADIYYIESIDNKTVVFCENENYQCKQRLYQVYDRINDMGFAQISKYCIANLNKIDKIKSIYNSRMEATLSNGKKLHINRKYIQDIKLKFKEDD
ncbi:MAG: LytTR family transcriptional regulator [Treponema sp.]|jgi:DNA-binding LytR/AlgR family response regulator|nr:LytTR family transcriptional regulator [Treponema sp.]